MKVSRIWLITVSLVMCAVAVPAAAEISILVDEIHGRPLSQDLAEALPQCEIMALTAADFPITDVIDSGLITEDETEIYFNVPEGAEVLYLQFDFSYTGTQLPFITLYGPNDQRLGSHCEGSLHVETPEPGEYRLSYSSWVPTTTDYVIGTGPPLFTVDLFQDYDLVCNLWDDTMLMFRGELPPYSEADKAAYMQYLEEGGGFLYVRQPLIEMALKPIINIYSGVDVTCQIDLGFPGMLTYAEPPCLTESVPAGTWFRWHDLEVTAGQQSQILYEGKLRRQTNWLQLSTPGGLPSVINRTDQPLADLHLIRYEGADDWRLVRVGSLSAQAEISATSGELLNGSTLKADIENIIRAGGRQAGLYEAEIEEFLAHYHWADRWLVDARADGQWCGLYRIGNTAYEAHIPFQGDPGVSEQVRTMWVWATGLGDDPGSEAPSGPEWPLTAPSIEATAPIIYHEYGVQYQRGSGTSDLGAKDFGFMGWTYYDGAAVLDPSDNCGGAECPWFTWTGGHPDADKFMAGVSVVVGSYPGTLTAPWSEQVLIGDDDAYTDDYVYPPGSFPPVAAAKTVGLGRAATIHTMTILSDLQDNRTFLGNMVAWLANELSGTPDTPARLSHIKAVTPNPFNPQTTITFSLEREGRAEIAVFDLTGRLVMSLADRTYTAGDHSIVWQGQDTKGRAMPSGSYIVRLETETGVEAKKVSLVR